MCPWSLTSMVSRFPYIFELIFLRKYQRKSCFWLWRWSSGSIWLRCHLEWRILVFWRWNKSKFFVNGFYRFLSCNLLFHFRRAKLLAVNWCDNRIWLSASIAHLATRLLIQLQKLWYVLALARPVSATRKSIFSRTLSIFCLGSMENITIRLNLQSTHINIHMLLETIKEKHSLSDVTIAMIVAPKRNSWIWIRWNGPMVRISH